MNRYEIKLNNIYYVVSANSKKQAVKIIINEIIKNNDKDNMKYIFKKVGV